MLPLPSHVCRTLQHICQLTIYAYTCNATLHKHGLMMKCCITVLQPHLLQRRIFEEDAELSLFRQHAVAR
jgi:hypothetical protein